MKIYRAGSSSKCCSCRQVGRTSFLRRGFTLVELLVVIVIIGLGISFVDFNIGSNERYRLMIEAKQFANGVSLALDEAVLSNRQWSVDFFRDDIEGVEQFGYRWLILDEPGQRNGQQQLPTWQLANSEYYEVEFLLLPGVELRLQLEGSSQQQTIEYKLPLAIVPSDDDESLTTNLPTNADEILQPEIWLMSSGEMNAFELEVIDPFNPDNPITIVGDELGRIRILTGLDDEE